MDLPGDTAAAESAAAALAGGSGGASAAAAGPWALRPAGNPGAGGHQWPRGPDPHQIREEGAPSTAGLRLEAGDQSAMLLREIGGGEGEAFPELPEELALEVAAGLERVRGMRQRRDPVLSDRGEPGEEGGDQGMRQRRSDHLLRFSASGAASSGHGPVKRQRTADSGRTGDVPEVMIVGESFPELPEQEVWAVLAAAVKSGEGTRAWAHPSTAMWIKRTFSARGASVKRRRHQTEPQPRPAGAAKRKRGSEERAERMSAEGPPEPTASDWTPQPLARRARTEGADEREMQVEDDANSAALRPYGRRYSGIRGDPVDASDPRGHLLFITGAMIWCGTCGRYATRRLGRALRAPCSGEAAGAYLTRLARLRQGLHPLSGRPLVE